LTSITIPNSVTSIGEHAFVGCNKIKDVYYSGTETQWKEIEIAYEGNEDLTGATIHYNGTGATNDKPDSPTDKPSSPTDKPDSPTTTATTSTGVYYIKDWNAETRTITFGDRSPLSGNTYVVPAGADASNVDALVKKYAQITTVSENGAEPTVTKIELVQSGFGTVANAGGGRLSFEDGKSFPISADTAEAAGDCKGKAMVYHCLNGQIIHFDYPEERSGICNDFSFGWITIDSTDYPTNSLSEIGPMINNALWEHKISYLILDGVVLRITAETEGNKIIEHKQLERYDQSKQLIYFKDGTVRKVANNYKPDIEGKEGCWFDCTIEYTGAAESLLTNMVLTGGDAQMEYKQLDKYDQSANIVYFKDGSSYKTGNGYTPEIQGKEGYWFLCTLEHMGNAETYLTLMKPVHKTAKVVVEVSDVEWNGSKFRLAKSSSGEFEGASSFDIPVTITVTNTSSNIPNVPDASTIVLKSLEMRDPEGFNRGWVFAPGEQEQPNGISLKRDEKWISKGFIRVDPGFKQGLAKEEYKVSATVHSNNSESFSGEGTFSITAVGSQGNLESESNTWKNTLLKEFYKSKDIDVEANAGKNYLRVYFDNDVVDDIGKAVGVWQAAMNSPLASEVRGGLPEYLKISCQMKAKYQKRSASIWFSIRNGQDFGFASFGSGVNFTIIDNETGLPLQSGVFSIKMSASSKAFADGMDQYLKKSYGKDWLDFSKNLMKKAVSDTIKDMAHVSGKEYINTMLDLLKDYKTICKTAKDVTGFAQKANDILKNPLNLQTATTKDFETCCKRVSAKCPVDVYIYNTSSTLCGSIVDDKIEVDNLQVFMVVSDDEKTIWLNDDYTVKLVATGEGTMEYTISECDTEGKERTISFNEVPLHSGLVYECNIAKELDTPSTDYVLTSNEGATVYANSDVAHTDGSVPSFEDVPPDAFYAQAVAWAVENGITNGTDINTFSPDDFCTRSEIVTFLWRANGSPTVNAKNTFADVETTDFFYDAVLWAVSKGITNGTDPNTFSPYATCTRGEAVTFLYRAEGSPAAGDNTFRDVASGMFYAKPVSWAVSKGITKGTGTDTFSPDDTCTRGEIVTFLYRAG